MGAIAPTGRSYKTLFHRHLEKKGVRAAADNTIQREKGSSRPIWARLIKLFRRLLHPIKD